MSFVVCRFVVFCLLSNLKLFWPPLRWIDIFLCEEFILVPSLSFNFGSALHKNKKQRSMGVDGLGRGRSLLPKFTGQCQTANYTSQKYTPAQAVPISILFKHTVHSTVPELYCCHAYTTYNLSLRRTN